MKYALIPAAGSSTRLRELGKQYAKTVLPFEGRPIIEHIVENIANNYIADAYIIAVASQLHYDQIIACSFSADNVKVVLFDDHVGAMKPGPAKTIICGLEQSGIEFRDDDELLIHLSDSLFDNLSLMGIPVDSISYGVLPDTADHSRWCMVSKNEDGVVFHDKPKDRPDTTLFVSGLYCIGQIPDLIELSKTITWEGESQISTLLALYNKVHPLKTYGAEIWKDFGTLEDYIANRGVSKSRSFNKIDDLGRTILKSSSKYPDKVISEGLFMQNQPEELRHFYPNISKVDTWAGSIEMEKVRSTNLRDLYLYMDRSESTWDEVFDSVATFTNACKNQYQKGSFWEGVVEKTTNRIIKRYDTPEVRQFMYKFIAAIASYSGRDSVTKFHGDLHFANMFYCFTYKDLKLVDPRGEFRGHWLYDVAKLNHSVVGNYDWIDSELYNTNGFYNLGTNGVVTAFEKFKDKIRMSEEENRLLPLITASLFLSMIPLHDHSTKNQDLFYEEFLRFL